MNGKTPRRAIAIGVALLATHVAGPHATSPANAARVVLSGAPPTRNDYPSPVFRTFPDGGLIVWHAREVFIDQHHRSFDIPVGRVRIDKLDTYRHLQVWRDYVIDWRVPRLGERDGPPVERSWRGGRRVYPRRIERYEHARTSDFLVHPDGYATHSGLRPLHATSAHIRPSVNAAEWIIVTDLEPGTIVRVTDAMGRQRDYVYMPASA